MNFEKFADEADVGATGELHFFRAMMEAEFRGKGFGECLRAGMARVDERAVNVEQNQFYHACKISERRNPARFYGDYRMIISRQPVLTVVLNCAKADCMKK